VRPESSRHGVRQRHIPLLATLGESEHRVPFHVLDLPDHMERVPIRVDGVLGQPEHLALTQPASGADIAREASYLLLRHAFEDLGAVRVALKTDTRNARSHKAITGLGAVREGVFRRHRILRDGHHRDSVFYSLIREDWDEVREKLAAQLEI
jgi:hypothetical protein